LLTHVYSAHEADGVHLHVLSCNVRDLYVYAY